MALVGGSPAQRAGLLDGDRLVSVNGHTLGGGVWTGETVRAQINRAQALLVAEMERGEVTLRVEGANGIRNVRFTAVDGCPATVELLPGAVVNAWADGRRIVIGEGLFRHCTSDDDLALVIAHEMAHNLLHHRERLAAQGVPFNLLLPIRTADATRVRETEEEADRFAVRLVSAAAYDLSGAETFLGGLARPGKTMSVTHPRLARRLALLRFAVAAQGSGSSGGWIAKTAASGLVSGRI